MKKRIISGLLAVMTLLPLKADEGMWPMTLLSKIQDRMQAQGLQLSAEDIYSINNSSVKDAVVRLMTKQGRMFCSGEIISSEGLFLTNHHCGYGAIQALATPQDNILTNGFWAMSKEQERPANFNIGLLRKIEDVTSQVLNGTEINGDEAARTQAINDNIKATQAALLEALGEDKGNYSVEISSFYNGNQYLAMFYEVYRDIRLVGTPPENVGKFGGETDNWRWPRHTCDFSMFRIYAGANNKPADYSSDNAPFAPAHHLPVSLAGAKEGDYAMTIGYPGRTTRYTYSEGIRYLGGKERPMRVQVRRDIMDIYESYMKADKDIRLMYADKLAGIGNYWNKFNGEAHDLSKPGMYERRKAAEKAFEEWVRSTGQEAVYGDVTGLFDEAYGILNKVGLYQVYLQDGIANSQAMLLALRASGLGAMLADKAQADAAKTMAGQMAAGVDEAFAEFYGPIEQAVLEQVLKHIVEDLDNSYLPQSLLDLATKYKRDYKAMAAALWAKSVFSSKEKYAAFLAKPSAKALNKDLLYVIVRDYYNALRDPSALGGMYADANGKIDRATRLFMSAQIQMAGDQVFAPDANATMRLSYGTIKSYEARDAVSYSYFTTSRGVNEKFVPADFEFDAPDELMTLIKNKDFGRYADVDGELHTCFLSNNDITGGNSGSPVINGKGELIGIAFDGNWEAISSDFAFLPEVQRTISVDIRYVMFIVDKLGGAGYLLDEMDVR